jgi:hypothetical protein
MARKTMKGRKTTKKVTRRRRKTAPLIENGLIVAVDDVYKIINRIQITREAADFIVCIIDSFVVDNILKDADLQFTKTQSKDSFHYKITPPPEPTSVRKEFSDFEEFPDEIIEDGQIFF